jgi:hypothetical protein
MPPFLSKKHLFAPERHLSFCPRQNLGSQAIKSFKTRFPTWLRGWVRFLGFASWLHAAFPFSSLQIKLFWPLQLESTFDFHLSAGQGHSPPKNSSRSIPVLKCFFLRFFQSKFFCKFCNIFIVVILMFLLTNSSISGEPHFLFIFLSRELSSHTDVMDTML